MSVKNLTKKIQQGTLNRTHEQRISMLRKANILDKEGFFSKEYFSENTIKNDKESSQVKVA
jgi:hypothetical protein